MNAYLDIIFVVLASMLFVSRIDYKFVAKILNNILVVLMLISIMIYFLVCVGHFNFSTSHFVSGSFRYDNYAFLSLFYNEKLYNIGGSPRFCSIFWEPGVCSTFLVIGLVNEAVYKKTNYFNVIIFLVCITLTKSSAAFVLLPFVLLIFLSEKVEGSKRKPILIISFAILGAFLTLLIFGSALLDKIIPGVFSKFSGSVSLFSRLNSPILYIKTFTSSIKTFFFGMGGLSASQYYYSIAPTGTVDSGTSTTFYLMAAYGLLGSLFTILPIGGIICSEERKNVTRFCYLFLFFLIFNKENHTSILLSIIISFYFIKNIPPLKFKNAQSYDLSKCNFGKSLGDVLFANNGKGIFGRNIAGNLVIKISAIFVSILTLPVYTSYFSNSHFLDVWLVIYSVLSWILLFDFGFGNGMKNKLIEAFTNKDQDRQKEIISNTYIPTLFIAALIFSGLFVTCNVTNLNVAFGDPDEFINRNYLKVSLIIIVLSICLQFVLRNITFIYQAQKRNVLGSSFSLISSSSLVLILTVFKGLTINKFLFIAISYCLSVNLPLLIANIVFFSKNKTLIPKFRLYSFSKCKTIMSLGLQYFTVQLSSLLLWSSNSLIITHLFDPSSTERFVYYYTCYYKIFSTIVSLLGIISTTVWIDAEESLISHNLLKLKKIMRFTLGYAIALLVFALACSLGLQIIFDLWLGGTPDGSISVKLLTVVVFMAYCVLTIISESFIIFANAFSHLKKQVIVSLIFAISKIPLIILFSKVAMFTQMWEIVVAFNAIYSLVLAIVLGLDLRKFIKKQIAIYGMPIVNQNTEFTFEFKEDEYYEIQI